jgi:hypothetical protein
MDQPSKDTTNHNSPMHQYVKQAIKPLTESAVDILCYRCQTAAPSIHGLALLRWPEIGPHTDPLDS